MAKVNWGVLSTAKIGREKVIPAMQAGDHCNVVAIASRDKELGQRTARQLGIPKVFASYEELLEDTSIDAVYIPLPNDLHVPWALRAIEAGKHVLCEKPIGLSVAEAKQLQEAADRHPKLKVMEAFMYRFHPQWVHAKQWVQQGRIGELRTMDTFFSYHNVDPNNIRNRKEAGGGGLMDIGCYCISWARFIFGQEPVRVSGKLEYDPVTQTDTLASGVLDFATGTSVFTCSTRLMPYQRVNILGTEARIEIEIPANAPPDKATRIWLHSKSGTEEFSFDPVNQYTLQGDSFSKAILQDGPVPVPLEDAVNNMKVIEAVVQSAKEKKWEQILP